jgi:Mg-chelatase subunit ChlD
MDDPKNDHIKLGLVSHGDPANIDSYLTDRAGTISGRVGNMRAGGEDNLSDSLSKSHAVLRRGRQGMKASPFEVAVVLSDGGQTYPPSRAVPAAGRLKGDGVLVISICADNGTPGGCQAMRQIASSGRYYFQARGTSGLNKIFSDIAEYVTNISMRSMTIEETLPDGLQLVPDSVFPEPQKVDTSGPTTIRWQLSFPRITETLGYVVKPSSITTYTGAANKTTFRDSQNRGGELIVPTKVLTVSGPCLDTPTPTPTPTNTPTPSPTFTPSPPNTATPTPTNTPTSTPTPTPVPRPLYLPLLNPWRCIERDKPADIVLLIDASSSMRLATAAGRPKIEAAQDGAREFVQFMREVDRASVIAFNSQAHTMAHLTSDRRALRAAIDAIETSEWTRMDLALLSASAELESDRGDASHTRVIILMTDGYPSRTTPEAVSQAAASARAAGTHIFVIGVGPDLNTELMIDVAGEPDRYYHVDDAEALKEIYALIAQRIPCVPPPGWVMPIE